MYFMDIHHLIILLGVNNGDYNSWHQRGEYNGSLTANINEKK